MVKEEEKNAILLGGGPLGLGDPDDKRLRKTEKDIILPKMLREEARKKCKETFELFYECSKKAGLAVTFKCRDEQKASNECIQSWCKNPNFVKEVTNKYLENRRHYRMTGEAMEIYERKKPRKTS